MTPQEFIQQVQAAMLAGQQQGGVILVSLDRWQQLRDQFGIGGLFKLMSQVEDRIMGGCGQEAPMALFSPASRLVLISGNSFESLVQAIFDDLRSASLTLGEEFIAVTVSMSAAGFDHRFADVDEMLGALMRRCEEITEDGGNGLDLIDPAVSRRQALESRRHMMGMLMEALESNSLKVVFQPLLATSGSDTVRSFQMLPRLQSSDGHLIAAAEFLPQAQLAGLLPVIDRWMMAHAIGLYRGGLKSRPIRLFINQSDTGLSDPERREWLIGQLARNETLRNRIVFEFRLEDAMAHINGLQHLASGIREFGAGICISRVDEHSRWELFGETLPCNFIRMSPAFVGQLTDEDDLIKRYIELSQPLRERGIRIIMPMIEDSRTAASIWRSGADYMQGNMIQEPEDTISAED